MPPVDMVDESLVYVGNLPFKLDREDLEALCLKAGSVVSASIMTHKFNGKSKGFGFVKFDTPGAAQKAVELLDGKEVVGRRVSANLARPRTAAPHGDAK